MSETAPVAPLLVSSPMKNKILFWVGTVAITGLLSWCTFIAKAVAKIPDIETVKEMIILQSPYVADKKVVELRLKQSEELNKKVVDTIDRNTKAIIDLRIELAKLVSLRERDAKYGSNK